MAGRVDGDHLEAEVDEAAQRLGVEHPLGGEPVDDHERHAPPADRHAHRVAVGQGDLLPGEARQGDVDLFVGLGARADDRLSRQRQAPAPSSTAAPRMLVSRSVVTVDADDDRVPPLVHGAQESCRSHR